VIGFLTPIAPNGAGVREASLIFLLGAILTLPVAIISALSFRLLIIARDLTVLIMPLPSGSGKQTFFRGGG
jgi:uncharacterized membrane protein YbhN (UPF0104 family)